MPMPPKRALRSRPYPTSSVSGMNKGLHFLHIFPNFAPGGMELRVTRIINGMGPEVRHTILALLGNYDARDFIASGIQVDYPAPPAKANIVRYVGELRAI